MKVQRLTFTERGLHYLLEQPRVSALGFRVTGNPKPLNPKPKQDQSDYTEALDKKMLQGHG